MSRLYQMNLIVYGAHSSEEVDAIAAACVEEWDFELDYHNDHMILLHAQNTLCGGETEEEFADRIAHSVWEAVGRYMKVEVSAMCLDTAPCEEHVRDMNAFDAWCKKHTAGASLPTTRPVEDGRA